MHALRVGYQGIELLESGRITLPVPEPERSRLMEIRGGTVRLDDLMPELDDVIQRLEQAPIRGMEPPPDLILEQWLIDTYQEHWRETWSPGVLE